MGLRRAGGRAGRRAGGRTGERSGLDKQRPGGVWGYAHMGCEHVIVGVHDRPASPRFKLFMADWRKFTVRCMNIKNTSMLDGLRFPCIRPSRCRYPKPRTAPAVYLRGESRGHGSCNGRKRGQT